MHIHDIKLIIKANKESFQKVIYLYEILDSIIPTFIYFFFQGTKRIMHNTAVIFDKHLKIFDATLLLLAVRIAEEVIPHYAQQLRERVQPDMITLGSLSLQQVRATKRNICVISPYSPAHQPCPLCCVSVALVNGHRVCSCVRAHLSFFFFVCSEAYVYCICVCYLLCLLIFFLFLSIFAPLLYFLPLTFFLPPLPFLKVLHFIFSAQALNLG